MPRATAVDLTSSVDELLKAELDVVIIGSGTAGVAVAEHLFDTSSLRIAVLERGGILTLTHVNNLFPNRRRRHFLDTFGVHPWCGDCADGLALYAVGGRGIAAGAHLRRFDEVDFRLWTPEGVWPQRVVEELDRYYPIAERRRRVSIGDVPGEAQAWAREQLREFHPQAPPIGVDFTRGDRFTVSRGYDSSAARLWETILEDRLTGGPHRFFVAPLTFARRLIQQGPSITGIECVSATGVMHVIRARAFVLAASPIESARLVLHSRLECRSEAAGRFLSEHIERRALVVLRQQKAVVDGEGISLVLTPTGDEHEDRRSRFQIHLRGQLERNEMVVAIGGFAAMEPNPENAVTLSPNHVDEFGVPKAHTRLRCNGSDDERARRLEQRILEVARLLEPLDFITEKFPLEVFAPTFTPDRRVQTMPPGRSYHEAGTLRMGPNPDGSVTNDAGRMHGITNLYAADASLFPSVGIANPMLTVTALAYLVATGIADTLS